MALNLFGPLEPIILHLQDTLTELNPDNIGPASLLTGTVQEITARCPGVFVKASNSAAASKPNLPTAFTDAQDYQVIIAVPHGVELIAPEFVAGPLAGLVIESLIGFAPTAQNQPLYFKGFGDHSINIGYAEFPLNFSTQLTYSKPIERG